MSKIINSIFGEALPGLQKMMDLTFRRNEAITSNIANAETPQYRATDVNFASELNRAFGQRPNDLLKTNSKHMDINRNAEAHLTTDYSGVTKPDGNNVDIDIQMGRLAYNSGRYTVAANLFRKQLQQLKTAIRESR